MTIQLVSISTAGTVSSDTMCKLLRKIAALGWKGPITLVLDNARYQHCTLVINLAATLQYSVGVPAFLFAQPHPDRAALEIRQTRCPLPPPLQYVRRFPRRDRR